jgi:hypothetical protein
MAVEWQASASRSKDMLIIEPQRFATTISRNIYTYFTLHRIDGTITSSLKAHALLASADAKPIFRRTSGFAPTLQFL